MSDTTHVALVGSNGTSTVFVVKSRPILPQVGSLVENGATLLHDGRDVSPYDTFADLRARPGDAFDVVVRGDMSGIDHQFSSFLKQTILPDILPGFVSYRAGRIL